MVMKLKCLNVGKYSFLWGNLHFFSFFKYNILLFLRFRIFLIFIILILNFLHYRDFNFYFLFKFIVLICKYFYYIYYIYDYFTGNTLFLLSDSFICFTLTIYLFVHMHFNILSDEFFSLFLYRTFLLFLSQI